MRGLPLISLREPFSIRSFIGSSPSQDIFDDNTAMGRAIRKVWINGKWTEVTSRGSSNSVRKARIFLVSSAIGISFGGILRALSEKKKAE